jgi:thiamine-monophosphate kinase
VSGGGEEAFVAWLRKATGRKSLVGDDTATLPPPRRGHRYVVTVDQQIEGTHFLSGLDPETLGRRLLRVNLSDLAASGATPRYAFLVLGLPEDVDPKSIVKGVLRDAKRYGVILAGGDVAHTDDFSSSLSLIGEKRAADAPLTRDRARPGHAIWLGGTVGESALGCELLLRAAADALERDADPGDAEPERPAAPERAVPAAAGPARAARRAVMRNLLPTPQLELGRWLAGLGRSAGACIDLSDGLGKDLARVTTASGVGAEIDLRRVRRATAPGFERLAEALELDPIAVALAGGEDYVLLFTLPPGIAPPARFRARCIGTVTRDRALILLDRA